MTKRLNSKHKVDRRLKVNLWGRPKSPFNKRAYPPGQHGQARSSKPSEKKPIMLENLRSIFYKMELSEKETRILSSVFANLSKKKVD